jgi:hypothetical protein
MIRGRLAPWLLGPTLLLTGCVGAPKGEGFRHHTTRSGIRVTPESTRRTTDFGYRSTPDIGKARGRKFQDVIPVGARITAVNVATDDGVRAIWLSYERDGVVGNTPRRGGDGGLTHVFELDGNEKLVGMDAAGRRDINQLTVVTNKRVKTFGDDGSLGDPSSWLTPEQMWQYVGVGITGRADRKLRQLSLRYQVRE